MKNNLLLSLTLLIFSVPAFSQNVGIGTNNPQTKLQVAGAISSTPVSAPAQAAYVIPDNTSVFRLTGVAGTQGNALSMATPKEGQYLIIFNDDNDAATFGGFNLSAGATITLNYINGAWRLTGRSDAVGPTGATGATGSAGATGPQGNAGTAGASGADGKNAYTTTTTGYTQPVLGNNVSVSVVNTSWMTTGQAVFVGGSGGYYIVNSIANSTTVVLTYLGGGGTGTVGAAGSGVSASGQTGAQGATGAQGNVGATGPQGSAGPTGAQGTAGATGAQGPTGAQGNAGATGPQGSVGPTGAQGTAGATGAQGPTGAQGNAGATGPQGSAGPTGAQGTAGATGAQGPTGAQGNAGATGPQGNAGPQGPTGLLGAGTAIGNTTYWNGTDWVLNSSNIYNNGGNVGVGTASPGTKLDVTGAIRTNNQLISTVATGTAPVAVSSTTMAPNLNADRVDDRHLSEIQFQQSGRDFPNGTLIQSDIDYSVVNGDPW
ncbi:MAG TPA: hypothetical protein VK174_04155, partial [Chitinophagales bacterium]|nr:hypothetical protein [Chitinophagales bacterium]